MGARYMVGAPNRLGIGCLGHTTKARGFYPCTATGFALWLLLRYSSSDRMCPCMVSHNFELACSCFDPRCANSFQLLTSFRYTALYHSSSNNLQNNSCNKKAL